MPRLSANLGFLWPERPLLDRIASAGRAGFAAIELHWPYDVPAENVREACKEHNLSVVALNTRTGSANGDFGLGALEGREREFQSAIDESIAYCGTVGASFIHAMAGVVMDGRRAAAERTLKANLAQAADKAGAAGLTLLLEAINPRDKPHYFYSTVAEVAATIEAAGCSNIKLMFDVYHVAVAEGDVISKLRRYRPIIGHVQIAAVPSRAEPDEGEIAYEAIFDELDRAGYHGWVGCEYKPRGDTDAGLAWFERWRALP